MKCGIFHLLAVFRLCWSLIFNNVWVFLFFGVDIFHQVFGYYITIFSGIISVPLVSFLYLGSFTFTFAKQSDIVLQISQVFLDFGYFWFGLFHFGYFLSTCLEVHWLLCTDIKVALWPPSSQYSHLWIIPFPWVWVEPVACF